MRQEDLLFGSALRPVDYYAGVTWEEDEAGFMAAWKGATSAVAANAAVGLIPSPTPAATEEADAGSAAKKER